VRRVSILIAVSLLFAVSAPAHAQMFCRETVSDKDYNIQVSVCVTDTTRDLIAFVKNLDSRRKEITFSECVVDLTSIGGGQHRTGRIRIEVYESRPNNRVMIAPRISPTLATGFRTLNTSYILCMYVVKVVEQSA
jgi:hypothetical protein